MEPRVDHQLLSYLNHLPRKMVELQEAQNIIEFVLHELCNESCFNVERAAYLVDNPDFDCFKGVAGFCSRERYAQDQWSSPDNFTEHMQNCHFNQKVRQLNGTSIRRDTHEKKRLEDIANTLEVGDHEYRIWQVNHGNYGVFIFKRIGKPNGCEQYMLNALHLLSFCPIY